jgi:hypothetical protein
MHARSPAVTTNVKLVINLPTRRGNIPVQESLILIDWKATFSLWACCADAKTGSTVALGLGVDVVRVVEGVVVVDAPEPYE